MFQILDPNGCIVNETALQNLNLKAEDILKMYTHMVRTSVFTKRAFIRASSTKEEGNTNTKEKLMPIYISPRGHEAIQIASVYATNHDDSLLWYARSHGTAIARGVNPKSIFSILYGIPDAEPIDDFFANSSMLPYILVGGHLGHTVGMAVGHKLRGNGRVAVAYLGDGAVSRGLFHGAVNWSSVFKLPAIFIIENNGVAVSTPSSVQTTTATFAEKANAHGVRSQHVDGCDIFAVLSSMRTALNYARKGHPSVIEGNVIRYDDHTTAIGVAQPMSADEINRRALLDPLLRTQKFICSDYFKDNFLNDGVQLSGTFLEMVKANKFDDLKSICENIETSAQDEMQQASTVIDKMKEINPISAQIIDKTVALAREPAQATYFDTEKNRELLTPTVLDNLTPRDAIGLAHYDIARCSNVLAYGEDVGAIGSVFRSTCLNRTLLEQLNLGHMQDHVLQRFLPLKTLMPNQFFDVPLDEETLAGVAVGLALSNINEERQIDSIIEVQFSGFVYSMYDQIMAQMGRYRQRSAGRADMPITIRLPYGGGFLIEHHREEEVHHFLNNPGLVIVAPVTVQDFYDMLWMSVISRKPVLYFEHKHIHRLNTESVTRSIPTIAIEHYGARLAKIGTDVTIATFGNMVHTAEKAGEILVQHDVSAEVIDLRVLKPLDMATIIESVRKTGRLVVVQEAPLMGSLAESIIAHMAINEMELFYSPPRAVTAQEMHHPPPQLWEQYIPQVQNIVDAVLGADREDCQIVGVMNELY